MRLIELKTGVSVRADKIDGIEKIDENTCRVYVGTRIYEATYPYDVLMQLLESGEVVGKRTTQDEQMAETMKKVDAVLEKAQHFAG